MAEYKDIRSDFVVRTQELLAACPTDNERNVTKLLNFAYGLIIYPKGQIHYRQWPKYTFDNIDKSYGITTNEIWYPNKEKNQYLLYQIIRHVRNGLAHGYIKGEYYEGNIIGVEIEDRERENLPANFRLQVSVEEFRQFVLKISTDYLVIYETIKRRRNILRR